MTVLRAEPYNLILSEPIVSLIEARNLIGYSVPSLENSGDAVCRTEPLSPIPVVTRVHELTTDVSITVSYANIYTDEQTGGSPIISLNMWYDQGVDNWVSVTGD